MADKKLKEIAEIKSRLVNTSLVIASLAGISLLSASIIRGIELRTNFYLYLHIPIYITILLVTIFRMKISYPVRAITLISMVFLISAIDFIKTGFLSAGFLSFTVAVIITALYFDLRKSLWVMIASIGYIAIIYLLYLNGIIIFKINYNSYATMPVTIIMLSLNIILYGLIISFSIRHIQNNLYSIIFSLRTKTEHLEEMTIKLQNEINERNISETKVINSEKNFRNIFEKSSDAILIANAERKILDFNEAYIKLSGQKESEIFSKPFDHFAIKEDQLKIDEYYKDIKSFPFRFEFQIDNSLDERRFYECTTSHITYDNQEAILFMIRDTTETKDLEKLNYLTAIEAEEKERSRFSKELHDGLGPLLSTLKIYLEIYFTNPDDSEIRDRINNTLLESIKSVKEISNNISPYILENMGLVKAINSFVEKIKYSNRFEIDFTSNLDYRLKPEIEISIYRFITELINNTIKHAMASKIQISIEIKQTKLVIFYSDNGIGFNIDDVSLTSKGIGLFNLRGRIEKLGGRIEMNSAKGSGFSMLATLKVDQKTDL